MWPSESSNVSGLGKVVVSNGNNGFDVYSLESGAQERSVGIPPGTASVGVPVRFIHGGFAFVGGSLSGDLRFWDTQSGVRVQNLKHGAVLVAPVFRCLTKPSEQERITLVCVCYTLHWSQPFSLIFSQAYCEVSQQPERFLIVSVSRGPDNSSHIRVWRATTVVVS